MAQTANMVINDGTTDQTFVPLTAQQGTNVPAEWTTLGDTFARAKRITLLVRPTANGNGNRKVSTRVTIPLELVEGQPTKTMTVSCEASLPSDSTSAERVQAMTILQNSLANTIVSDAFVYGSPAY